MKDKAVLLTFNLLWFLGAFLRTLRIPCRRPFLIADVFVKTCDGLYRCRKGTDDAAIILSPVEEIVRRFVRENLNKGIFVDVGAHIGLYTIMGGKLLQGRGQVIAIEPEPSNFGALQTNVELNELDNVIPLNVAACEENKDVILLYPPKGGSTGWPTIVPQPQGNVLKQIKVRGVKLDDIITSIGNINDIALVKIDVEDAEEQVFLGMKRILQQPNIQILFESLPDRSTVFGFLVDMRFCVEPFIGSLMYRAWKSNK